ncbi:23S rRNA (guanine745-N1)-methyltransferase [Gracilibacillus ureilyticus]|uniref:23S rRNA (Guanine745-N1)-methyltransferase n=1 Tax=Gracilibacillus ureilyticus TaxID=531814 RepID=A0A1H9NHJ9_9BACI|nr:methyltransferase domain-containing protein [Gracilibacillus ureilyticus]SER35237.1 23S rRNA (guanine745-N1)-methyltransferase [Gracilibacillus ureilyticus]
MKKIEKTARLIEKHDQLFACPICGREIKVEGNTVRCPGNHPFDIAKKGYINLLMQASPEDYSKELFNDRHTIIMAGMYRQMHIMIAEQLKQVLSPSDTACLDVGCGEGSHLVQILEYINKENMIGVGIDISKDGIMTAAKYYEDVIWTVGDLSKSPFQSKQFDIILNILSPANYHEFSRLLKATGLMIKVIPQANYLREIREQVLDEEKRKYTNDQTIEKFRKHFPEMEKRRVQYKWQVDPVYQEALLNMTPLTWGKDKANLSLEEVTIDLDILIAKSTQM